MEKIKSLLKDTLIGEKVEGKGGFANLLKIKMNTIILL